MNVIWRFKGVLLDKLQDILTMMVSEFLPDHWTRSLKNQGMLTIPFFTHHQILGVLGR
jgi:hypothetical protein